MNITREPVVPQGDTQEANRFSVALREMASALTRSGAFLLRATVGPIIVPRAEAQSALKWGALNRVYLTGDFSVQLPRLRPEFVGVPLKLIITADTTNVLSLVPTGARLSDTTARPLINGAATLDLDAIGVYVLENDGQNWFTGPT